MKGCRWPIGEPGADGFHLCGRAIARGSYCTDHASAAYNPAQTPAEVNRWIKQTIYSSEKWRRR